MKYFLILSLASLAAAARLENIYLPPNAKSSSGSNAGLQAPSGFGQSSSYTAAKTSASAGSQAEILKFENEINEQGFRYAYETSDGTKAQQEGHVIPGAKPEEGSLQVQGSFEYVGDDGQTYTITYKADENGYQAAGAHLPTPPPIPDDILKSLQLTAGNGGNYNSPRNSYDADAGYSY